MRAWSSAELQDGMHGCVAAVIERYDMSRGEAARADRVLLGLRLDPSFRTVCQVSPHFLVQRFF